MRLNAKYWDKRVKIEEKAIEETWHEKVRCIFHDIARPAEIDNLTEKQLKTFLQNKANLLNQVFL